MRRHALFIVLVAAACGAGCVLHHVESDPDAALFAQAWETPRLAQHAVVLNFRVAGSPSDSGAARQEALSILLDSGKFQKLATPQDKPEYTIEIDVVHRHKPRTISLVLGALVLYLLPVDAGEDLVEVFADIRKPSGELVSHFYAQGRGTTTVWIGNLLWPSGQTNAETVIAIRRETLKAVTVKMCRALMPKGKE